MGESPDVTVMLDMPLVEFGAVVSMAHIDMDGDGVHQFMLPDAAIDIAATTEEGNVAVVPANVTIDG